MKWYKVLIISYKLQLQMIIIFPYYYMSISFNESKYNEFLRQAFKNAKSFLKL